MNKKSKLNEDRYADLERRLTKKNNELKELKIKLRNAPTVDSREEIENSIDICQNDIANIESELAEIRYLDNGSAYDYSGYVDEDMKYIDEAYRYNKFEHFVEKFKDDYNIIVEWRFFVDDKEIDGCTMKCLYIDSYANSVWNHQHIQDTIETVDSILTQYNIRHYTNTLDNGKLDNYMFVCADDLDKFLNEGLEEGVSSVYLDVLDDYHKALAKAEKSGNVIYTIETEDDEEEFDTWNAALKYAKKHNIDKIHVSSFGFEGPDGYDNGDYAEYDEQVLDLNKEPVKENLKEDIEHTIKVWRATAPETISYVTPGKEEFDEEKFLDMISNDNGWPIDEIRYEIVNKVEEELNKEHLCEFRSNELKSISSEQDIIDILNDKYSDTDFTLKPGTFEIIDSVPGYVASYIGGKKFYKTNTKGIYDEIVMLTNAPGSDKYYVGQWIDNKGKVCIDKNASINDFGEAIIFGINNNQDAIYNFDKDKVIKIDKNTKEITCEKGFTQEEIDSIKKLEGEDSGYVVISSEKLPVKIKESLKESNEEKVVEETKEYKIVKTNSISYKSKNGVAVGKPIKRPIFQVYFRTQDFNSSVDRCMNRGWSLQLTDFKTLEDARAYVKKYGKELKDELEEDIEKHDTLNPAIFDVETEEMLPEVREKLLEIVNHFVDGVHDDELDLDVKDIVLIGSNANYNYTKDSDLDIHIIASSKPDCNKKHLNQIYQAYKSMFNKNYDIYIHGYPAEVYVEMDEVNARSGGIYSIQDNKWLKQPKQFEIPDIDYDSLYKEVDKWEERYFELVNYIDEYENASEEVDKYIDDIYEVRKNGIAEDGEFSVSNLVFKEIRNRGYLDNLKQLKTELASKEMSLESIDK